MERMENIKLEQLYSKYKSQIYSLCIKLTMSKELSEDLFSETWVRVAEKYHQIDPAQNTFNWIYTICLNIYRKKKLKHTIVQYFTEYTYLNHSVNEINVEDQYIDKELTGTLQKAIRQLPDKYRIPIILFYYRELNYQDISEIMKLPMSTVKYRLNQAKKILKSKLDM